MFNTRKFFVGLAVFCVIAFVVTARYEIASAMILSALAFIAAVGQAKYLADHESAGRLPKTRDERRLDAATTCRALWDIIEDEDASIVLVSAAERKLSALLREKFDNAGDDLDELGEVFLNCPLDDPLRSEVGERGQALAGSVGEVFLFSDMQHFLGVGRMTPLTERAITRAAQYLEGRHRSAFGTLLCGGQPGGVTLSA